MRTCLIAATRYPVANDMPWPSLGIAYIASMLERNGHEVCVVDRECDSRKIGDREKVDRKTLRTLHAFLPDLVGISATSPNIPDAYHLARVIKKDFPNVLVLIGGAHASVLPEETLRECDELDLVVRGEGELPLLELAAGKNPADVDFLVFRRENAEFVHTPQRKLHAELDDYPMPAWHLLEMDYYLSRNARVIRGVELRATHLFTSRGCPFNCYFCANLAIPGIGIRFHSPQRVVREIEHLIGRYGAEGIYFIDDLFAVSKKRVAEICEALVGAGLHRKIVWASQERVNCVDEEILRRMQEAGCIQVEFGFESGSQRMLDKINKRTTVAQNFAAAAMTRRVGLRLGSNTIVGLPGENLEDVRLTVDFLKQIRPDFVGFWKFSPSVGSPFFFRLKEEGKLDSDWRNYLARKDQNYSAMACVDLSRAFREAARNFVAPLNEWNSFRYNSQENPFFRFNPLERLLRRGLLWIRSALRWILGWRRRERPGDGAS